MVIAAVVELFGKESKTLFIRQSHQSVDDPFSDSSSHHVLLILSSEIFDNDNQTSTNPTTSMRAGGIEEAKPRHDGDILRRMPIKRLARHVRGSAFMLVADRMRVGVKGYGHKSISSIMASVSLVSRTGVDPLAREWLLEGSNMFVRGTTTTFSLDIIFDGIYFDGGGGRRTMGRRKLAEIDK